MERETGERTLHSGSTVRRLFRAQGQFPADRCRACDGYYTLLTETVFEKTRQRPATLVLLRGVAKGEPTARLARELGLSRKQLHTLRQRIQTHHMMMGSAFEGDELYQNAGGKKHAASRPADPPRRRANERKGHGTYANDRPPIISVISRETGEQRCWVCDQADRQTCPTALPKTCPRAAHCPIPTNSRVIAAAIRATARWSRRSATVGMLCANCTAVQGTFGKRHHSQPDSSPVWPHADDP